MAEQLGAEAAGVILLNSSQSKSKYVDCETSIPLVIVLYTYHTHDAL